MINDHNCSQICVEVEGSFNCSCYSGYELQDDGATCEGNTFTPHSIHCQMFLHIWCMYHTSMEFYIVLYIVL